MVDRISPQARSRIMAAIRSVDTQPELLLRKALSGSENSQETWRVTKPPGMGFSSRVGVF